MTLKTLLTASLLALIANAAIAAETLNIGFNYPQTGRYKQVGLQERLGAFMAMDQINNAGGIMGRQINLVIRNSASEPERGASNTAELIDKHDAAMVFGGASSAVAIASGRAAKARDRLYFGTLTYSNATTGSAGHTHMFREPTSAWMSAKALAGYLHKQFSGKKFYYITADYTWGWTTEASVRRFTETGDETAHPGIKTPFPGAHISDFTAALKKAAASDADVLMMVLFGGDMVRALTLAYEMGLKEDMQIVVPNITLGMANQVGPSIMEGVIATVPWTWKVPYQFGYERGQQFVEEFVKRYGMSPSTAAASAYSILYQYKDAVERAGSFNTAAVIEALEGHRYTLLKDEQQWRAFDHQNIQTVYVVKSNPRKKVLANQTDDDYFDIVDSMDGQAAAKTLAEWKQQRQSASKPMALR